jgi:hypothetical protein
MLKNSYLTPTLKLIMESIGFLKEVLPPYKIKELVDLVGLSDLLVD